MQLESNKKEIFLNDEYAIKSDDLVLKKCFYWTKKLVSLEALFWQFIFSDCLSQLTSDSYAEVNDSLFCP